MPRQQHHAVKPQVGDLAYHMQFITLLGRQQRFGGFFGHFAQNGVFALGHQPGHIGTGRISAFACRQRLTQPLQYLGVDHFPVSLAIDFLRILEHRVYRHPFTVRVAIKKTTLTPGMTGNATHLFHFHQHHVFIAI